MADAFTRNDLTSEDEWTCKKTVRAADIAFGNFAPEQSAADDFAAVDDRRNDNHFETKALAQLLERRCVAGLLVAEAEVFSDEQGANAQLVDEDLLNEFFWREARKVERKSLDDGGLEANHAKPCRPPIVR